MSATLLEGWGPHDSTPRCASCGDAATTGAHAVEVAAAVVLHYALCSYCFRHVDAHDLVTECVPTVAVRNRGCYW